MKVLLKHQKITEDNCCFMKSRFEYLNRMNLYFLISGEKHNHFSVNKGLIDQHLKFLSETSTSFLSPYLKFIY